MIQVIMLNGGSSSGKTSIATCLQEISPSSWLRLGVDTLVDTLPRRLLTEETGLAFGDDGSVRPGAEFQRLESAWMQGVAAMARAGANIIYDDVLLSGAKGRGRWQAALAGVAVLWVGVRCDPIVAAEREHARGDRVAGMAEMQARMVHVGVEYDLEVDTTNTSAMVCAQLIAQQVGG